jgi:hypothetical protein
MTLKLTCKQDMVLVHYEDQALEVHPFFVNRFAEKMDIIRNPPDNTLIIEFTGDLKVKDYDGIRLLIVA